MGFKLTLKKEYNTLYCDFIDAYWTINGIALTTDNGIFKISCEIKCYATREAKYKTGDTISSLTFGSATAPTFNPHLYQFVLTDSTVNIFGENPIPTTEPQIKKAIYTYLKNNFSEFANAEDVFEEN